MSSYWRKPKLDVEGQSAFWDKQASTYEDAAMTNDNEQEMRATIRCCREISCEEIITLGGAVGCRDPKMILEELFFGDYPQEFLPKVIFNDLSVQQVKWAQEKTLKRFAGAGVEITYLPGEIKDVCNEIDKRNPRRLVIGVYDCRSFFEADPPAGYPLCGYDGYLENGDTIGHKLLMNWVRYAHGGNLIPCEMLLNVSSSDCLEKQKITKEVLEVHYREIVGGDAEDTLGLQIIGRSKGRKGFFLSHWYIPGAFRVMLEEVFPPNDFSITESHFAKGMIFVIDPAESKLRGVVTVLNNVIGNVLPQSQFETLHAIKRIIS